VIDFSGSVVLGGDGQYATDHHQVVVPQLYVSESGGGITFPDLTVQTTAFDVTNGLSITGSVNGNVTAVLIGSNTASLDLSGANFFDLNIVDGTDTFVTVTNINKGQTVNLKVTNGPSGSGTISFDSMFKFPAGSNYTGSAASNAVDIVSFVTFDTTNLYANSIENLI